MLQLSTARAKVTLVIYSRARGPREKTNLAHYGFNACRYHRGNVGWPTLGADRRGQPERLPAPDVADPLVQDAQWYANDQNVPLQEAVRRLRLQYSIGDLDAELMAQEPDTYGGLWIQHQPQFGVVVRFTRDGEQKIRPYVEGGPLADLVETRQASATFRQLEADQAKASRLAAFLGVPAESGIDVKTNVAYLNLVDPARLNRVLQTSGFSLPNEVAVREVERLLTPSEPVYAGLKINPAGPNNYCTTGFVVRHVINDDEGVTTAGHCEDDTYFRGTYFPKRAGAFSGPYDLQWHNSPGYEDRAWIRDGYSDSSTPGYRYVTGARGRLDQPVDSLVCHYGVGGDAPELQCGYIRDRSYRPPEGPGQWNNPSATFVRVVNNNVDLDDLGDSGGPWFIGGTALGLHSGGNQTSASIYMSITYFNDDGPEDFNLKVQQVD